MITPQKWKIVFSTVQLIYIYICDDSAKIKNAIQYYKDYYIYLNIKDEYYDDIDQNESYQSNILNNYKDINVNNLKVIRTIVEHTECVNSLFLLKDKRIASCSDDNTIRIYDPSNYYLCDQVIQRHTKSILSICQLDDGTIVSCSEDKSICIGEHTIPNAHSDYINKVIALPNNRIASCSADGTIKIWKSDKPYSDKPIIVLEGHSKSVTSLLYIKERKVTISGSMDETL